MSVEVKRTTEIRVSGKDLRPLVLMAQVVLELIMEGGSDACELADGLGVRNLAEFLISIGYEHEEV